MKIEIRLIAEDNTNEIVTLNDYIREQNIKGIITTIKEEEPVQGAMNLNDYMPIIKLVLGSTATAAVVKGIFDIIKNYFDLYKQKYVSRADIEKEKIKQSKVEFTFEESGKKVSLNFSTFDITERDKFFETVDNVLGEKAQ